MFNKTFFQMLSAALAALTVALYFIDWQCIGVECGVNGFLLAGFLIVAFFVYSYSWTYTPEGRLDYRAALSLRAFTFNLTIKPDSDLDFKVRLPINLWFGLSALAPKDKVARIEDISIEHSGLKIPARVYWPSTTSSESLSLLIYYHGGGFALGDLNIFDPIARSLAVATQSVVISVDYRLAPRHPYPAAIDDAYAALLWASENASSLGADGSRLMVAGDSAGGNLAAVSALRARDENGPKIAAQLLYYPATDLAGGTPGEEREQWVNTLKFQNGYIFTTESLRKFRDAYCGNEDDTSIASLSPARADNLGELPPTFLATAGFDPLTDGANLYGDRFKQAGGELTQAHYPEMIHGFLGVNLFSQRRDVLNKTREFVNRQIHS